MPTRSRHLSMLAELSASPSSSTSSLHGVTDIDGLKEVVLDLSNRLEVLEKVFVFVDFDQINQAIAKFGVQGAAGDKVGADQVLSAPPPPDVLRYDTTSENSAAKKKTKSKHTTKHPSLHAGTASGDCRNSLESSHEPAGSACSSGLASSGFDESKSNANFMQTSKPRCPAAVGYLQPLTSPSVDVLPQRAMSVGNLSQILKSGSKKDAGVLDGSITRQKNNFSGTTIIESELLKDPKAKLSLASTADDSEFGSTCSTWNQTFSSRSQGGDLGNDNDLIDPERFDKFLKQAIRPRWQMEQRREGRTQSKSGIDDDRAANDIDDIMGAILEERSRPKQ